MAGFACNAQKFSGKIIDKETKESIPFARIELKELHIIGVADKSGEFIFTGEWPDLLLCQVSALTYETRTVSVTCCDYLTIELEPDPHDMDEVSVTAQIRELNGSNTQKVDRIDLKKLSYLSPLSLSESLSQLQGVQMASYGPLNSKPVIRGLQGMRVVTLLNGMRIENQQWGGDHGLGISQVGLESAEVIKGPMSLMYQGDATGGMIYLRDASFAPVNSFSAEINSQLETTNLRTQNSVLFKMSGKKIRFSMAGIYSNAADYRLPNKLFLSDSRMQDRGAKFNLGYNHKKWNFRLNYLYSNTIVGIPGHTHDSIIVPSSFMTDAQNRNRSLPHQWITNHFANLKTSYFISKKHKADLWVSYGSNDLSEYEEKITSPALRMALGSATSRFRHTWTLNERVKLSSGAQYSFQTNRNDPNVEESLLIDSDQQDLGVFTSLSIEIGKLKINSTIRIDDRKISTQPFSKNYTNLNGSIGIRRIWESESKHDLAFHVSTGSRAPHTSELLSDGIHHGSARYELGDTTLPSERFTQLDLSYDFTGNHLSFVVNPYIMYSKDFIQIAALDSFIDAYGVYQYQSVDEALLYGIESRVHYHPHFAHILHLETGVSASFGQSFSGEDLYFFPQPRLRSNVRVDLSGIKQIGFESLVLQHEYYFRQDRIGPLESATPSYHFVQLGCTMKWETKHPLEFSFGVRNALNATYVNHLSSLKLLGLSEPGRSFYINLKWLINGNIKSK